jgi:Ulp1 family protease
MKKNPILDQALLELDDSNVHLYSVTLLDDSRKDKESRNGRFSRSITDNKLLLIYPFQALDEAIEEAAQGLNEASLQIGKEQNILMEVDANDVTDSQEKLVRAHYLTIRDEDRLRLINDEFLNDTLVDFWMQWYGHGSIIVFPQYVEIFPFMSSSLLP